ncbi:hypothetical protein NA57DRAFT_79618 [Rhizodiscina lignyota]|uniref:Uncharacterized protein n=1 Tax=Rhizodiscina lignyota TaxID=1504668 RepID=A0A9P4IBB3_9PEZI|nr:hypothetical protein NA57DRAFT_79618 [Rhizodiscina lignyota]
MAEEKKSHEGLEDSDYLYKLACKIADKNPALVLESVRKVLEGKRASTRLTAEEQEVQNYIHEHYDNKVAECSAAAQARAQSEPGAVATMSPHLNEPIPAHPREGAVSSEGTLFQLPSPQPNPETNRRNATAATIIGSLLVGLSVLTEQAQWQLSMGHTHNHPSVRWLESFPDQEEVHLPTLGLVIDQNWCREAYR